MSYFTRNPLTTYDAEIAVADDSAGAIVSFVGTTRNRHHGKAVNYLEYEAVEQVAHHQASVPGRRGHPLRELVDVAQRDRHCARART